MLLDRGAYPYFATKRGDTCVDYCSSSPEILKMLSSIKDDCLIDKLPGNINLSFYLAVYLINIEFMVHNRIRWKHRIVLSSFHHPSHYFLSSSSTILSYLILSSSLPHLLDEILLQICFQMPLESLGRMSCVGRRFLRICGEDVIWENLCRTRAISRKGKI